MRKLYPLRKRAFRAALLTLLLCVAGVTNLHAQAPTGAINGTFTINSNGDRVYFSQGNLQYQASTNTWRFAEHQWDYVGADNASISETYDGWIDLFGWGTSGYNHGANCYQPWSTSQSYSDYYAYGNYQNNLFDQTGQADWGYNAIANGGNTENSGWRTLTQTEWSYMFNTRATASGIRYAKARVNSVNGVILLPDDWSANVYSLNNTNSSGAAFTSNVLGASQWTGLQSLGAVFLPAAGFRDGASVYDMGSYGHYWSASCSYIDYAYSVDFTNGYLYTYDSRFLLYGQSVRLVCSVENYSSIIHAFPYPAGGGAVSGSGAYLEGTACTLTATPTEGFTFVNWTENGEVVSTNAQYSFTVASHRTLQANFTKPGNITFADANVKALCVANWDANGDGELSYDEAAYVTDLGNIFEGNTTITSFAELQFFVGLLCITEYAFNGCSSLNTITLPSSLQEVGDSAFSGCTALTSVYYTGDIAQWCGIQFSNEYSNPLAYASLLFINNVLVRNLEIPNTVTSIGNSAFYNYKSLLSLSLPNGLTSIGDCAFSGCSGLNGNLTLPNTLKSIGNHAFYGCSGLNGNLTLPNTLESIGDYAFYWCSGFNGNLTLPNTLESIGDYAFCECSGFNGNLTLPNTLESIGDHAFYWCSGFNGNLTLPNTLKSIGSYAFCGCSGLTGELTLPNTLTVIESGIFDCCGGFTAVIIPNSVTIIGSYAFYSCDGLISVTIGTGVSQIGYNAFSSCSGLKEVNFNATGCSSGNLFQYCNKLETLTIGENVLTLGNNAFTDCTHLQSIRCLGNNPPIITSTVFNSSILESVEVFVPCEAKATYQADPIWGNFTNYQASAYELTAIPEDATQGSVSIEQYGNCDDPTTIVKANPNLHYGFSCWLKDGEVVSTDRVYTFTLEENMTLVARFVDNESITPHWVANHNAYSGNMSVTYVVEIDGVEQASSALELGAFCGDECRGSVIAEYFPPADRYIYYLTLFGNNGDVINFRLFDHNNQQELVLFCETELTYVTEGDYMYPDNPWVISFFSKVNINATVTPVGSGTVTGMGEYYPGETVVLTATANEGYTFNCWKENGIVVSTEPEYSFTVTGARNLVACFDHVQQTALNEGWNWWSGYIELSGIDGLAQLENSLGSSGIQIKSRNNGFVQYSNSMWFGLLEDVGIGNEQFYMVKTSSECQASLVGQWAEPYNHSITIASGWNWIGYPCHQSISLQTALSGFTPEDHDNIKSRFKVATYYVNEADGTGSWQGTLKTMEPGMGYMYESKSSGTKTLTFTQGRGETAEANLSTENNFFKPSVGDFADNMVVMAVLDLNGEELRGEQYELAAFAGDECRGSVKLLYVDVIDRYVAFLTVFGEQDDLLTFRFTDGTTTVTAAESTSFAANDNKGSLKDPLVLHFRGAGVSDEAAPVVSVYPNPSNGAYFVEGQGLRLVEVFNAFGQRVFVQEANGNIQKVDLSHYADGVYQVRVVTSEGVSNHAVVKQ